MATEQQEHLKIEQLKQHSADELEHIEGREKENLEGWIPALASDAELVAAVAILAATRVARKIMRPTPLFDTSVHRVCTGVNA